jgi:hypothetical protein
MIEADSVRRFFCSTRRACRCERSPGACTSVAIPWQWSSHKEANCPSWSALPNKKIDSQLLQRLYEQCDGWIQRMHEKLAEEQGIEVKYSTLTRMLRQLGISKSQQSRCSQVPDEPGAEMQHDTTLYRLKLGQRNSTE